MAGSVGKCIYGTARYSYTLVHRRCTILRSCQWMKCVCFPTAFSMEYIIELLKFWGSLFKILSLCVFFPSQNENIPVAVTEESRSEGKIGLKAYKNYFTAGTHWCIIIFLILLNTAAQVSRDIGVILCC